MPTKIRKKARNHLPGIKNNHKDKATLACWASMVREVGKGRKLSISKREIEELLCNDPYKIEHIELLRKVTGAVVEGRRAANSNYYLVAEIGPKQLWAGFAVTDTAVSAPNAQNIISRHYSAPLVFEIREGTRQLARMFVTITGGELYVLGGNREKLLSFIS